MRKRNMSEFMTIELLYDYKIGKLDSIRAEAIEEGLKNSPLAQAELTKLGVGIEYCDMLKRIEISDDLLKRLLDRPTTKQKIFHYIAWKNIPQAFKWGVEALIVAFAITFFIIEFPKFYTEDSVTESIVAQTFQPAPLTDYNTLKDQIVPQQTGAPVTEQGEDDNQPEIPFETADLPADTPVNSVPAVEDVNVPTTAQEQVKPDVPRSKVVRTGYIYRISFKNENAYEITPDLVEKIISLGGKKAGQVELGWKKSNGSYFHFAIPDTSYDMLIDTLSKYGSFSVDKSEHPRVMPDGVLRFIVWIEK